MIRKTRLFTPGPTPLLPAAQFAMAAADIHHRTPEFRALYERVLNQLKSFVGTKNDVLLRFINVFYRMSRQRREIYFHTPMQSKRSHAQHLQLYRAIEQQDVEAGLRILRRHLKGVDTYFRMFFSEGPGADADAPQAQFPTRPPKRFAVSARRLWSTRSHASHAASSASSRASGASTALRREARRSWDAS